MKKLFSFHYIFTKAASQRRQKRKFSYLTIWKVKKRDTWMMYMYATICCLVTIIPAFLPSSLLVIITLPPWITLGSICLGRWGLQHQNEQINIIITHLILCTAQQFILLFVRQFNPSEFNTNKTMRLLFKCGCDYLDSLISFQKVRMKCTNYCTYIIECEWAVTTTRAARKA